MKHVVVAVGILLTVAAWFLRDVLSPWWLRGALFWAGILLSIVGLVVQVLHDRHERKYRAFQ